MSDKSELSDLGAVIATEIGFSDFGEFCSWTQKASLSSTVCSNNSTDLKHLKHHHFSLEWFFVILVNFQGVLPHCLVGFLVKYSVTILIFSLVTWSQALLRVLAHDLKYHWHTIDLFEKIVWVPNGIKEEANLRLGIYLIPMQLSHYLMHPFTKGIRFYSSASKWPHMICSWQTAHWDASLLFLWKAGCVSVTEHMALYL